MNKKMIVGLIILIGLAAGVWYGTKLFSRVVPPIATSGAPKVVRIGSFSTAVDYGPLFVAKAKGYFDEELSKVNAKAEFTEFQTLPSITEAFASDQIEFVFQAEPPAIIARSGGNDVRIVGISCSLRQEVIVPSNSAITAIPELRGRKIAVLAGTSSHYGLLKIAQAAGLSTGDISVIDMVPPDAKAAFSRGEVDAWAVWPPWVEQELLAGTGRVIPASEALIHSVVVARGSFIDQNGAEARAVLQAVGRARSWMLENPGEAKSVLAEQLKLPLEVVNLAWPKHDWSATLSAGVIGDIQAKADFLVDQKKIRNRVDVTHLVTPLATGG